MMKGYADNIEVLPSLRLKNAYDVFKSFGDIGLLIDENSDGKLAFVQGAYNPTNYVLSATDLYQIKLYTDR